jgi:hypothetical protein
MHHAFRDALAIELGHFLEEKMVFHQDRAPRTGGDGVLVVADRPAGRRGHQWTGRWFAFVCFHEGPLMTIL